MPYELKKYECWNAVPVYKFRFNEETGERERYLAKVDKVGFTPLYSTSIEPRHAESLNQQLEISGRYYFEA